MTWHFDPSGETFDLYDHTGNLVASDVPFSGSWSDYPPEVTAKMREIWEGEVNLGNSPVMSEYAGRLLMHMVEGDIEGGTP